MPGIIVFVAFCATVWGAWSSVSSDLEKRGRGWFFRNWIGATLGAFLGLVVALSLSAEHWGWIALGGLVCAAAVSAPYKKRQELQDKPASAAPAALPASVDKPRIVRGKKLDRVRFDYINADGEHSSRRVLVQMVGEWQFEGIDLDKGEERTFRYDRVVGLITSETTGETHDPESWAATFR